MSRWPGLVFQGIVVAGLLVLAASIGTAAPTGASPDLITQDLTTGLTPAALAQALVSGGVTISNVTYTGADVAAGAFSGGTGIIGFPSGIILSSGNIADVAGPNENDATGTGNGTPGDTNLNTLSGFETFDAAVLEFDFVPKTSTVSFRYVFASEEYNEWVNTQYNDVFAFFINGVNCATVPGTGQPISINTINNGNPFGTDPRQNPALYRNNDLEDGGGSIDTEMDGLTVVLTCVAPVNANVLNHMKLAIADASDEIYDAVVFLEAGSLVGAGPGDTNCSGGTDAVDALHVLRKVAGLQPEAECIAVGNVKCDDDLTAVDALFILRRVAGLPVNLPPGCPAIP